MINNLLHKLAFRQAIPDLRASSSTGFIDDQTGAAAQDPRFPSDNFQRRASKASPAKIVSGDVPDLERNFGLQGVVDTQGSSSTGFVNGGHSV